MKRIYLWRHALLCLCVLAVVVLGSRPDAAWAVDEVRPVMPRIFRLENGLQILVREDGRFPLASTRLYVRAGSAWEHPEEAGWTHFLEHLVFKGSDTAERGVDSTIENAGGYLNAYTSFDNTVYLNDLPSKNWKVGVRAVRDLVFDPLLRPDEFESERQVVLAEMKQRGDMPFSVLYNNTFGLALAGTVYERPVIGFRETIEAATPEKVAAYMKRRYAPQDMLLVVAGDVRAEEVLVEARDLFGQYQNPVVQEFPEARDPEDLVHGLRVRVKPGPWNKAYVSAAFPIAAIGSPRNPATDVLARMLGGDDTSILIRELRINRGLVDMIMASAVNQEQAGLFLIIAQMDGDKVDPYLSALAGILSDLSSDSFTEEELERAKLNLVDDFWLGQETVADIADMAGNLYFFGPQDPSGSGYLDAIEDVGFEQVQQVIEARLRPEAMSVMALVPEGAPAESVTAALTEAVTGVWPGPTMTTGSVPAPSETQAGLGMPEVKDLGQGRALVVWTDRNQPYVTATLSFLGGDLFVGSENQGLGPFTASMLTSATRDKDHARMNAYLMDRASGLSATAGLTDFTVTVDTPSRFSDDMFGLLSEVLTSPAFRPEDMERVRREQIASIVSEEESVTGLMRRNLQPFLFEGTVYGHRLSGTVETVADVTREDVLAYWEKQRTRPWVLSVVGDMDMREAEAFALGLPVPEAPAVELPAAAWNPDRELTLTLPGREQAAYVMLFPTVPVDHEDSPALGLLSSSIGGMSGLLFQELREKRSLGYSVFPSNYPGNKAGFLAFYIIASPENLEEARSNFMRIAGELHEQTLPEATVARAKEVLEADYYRGQQSRASRALTVGGNLLYGHPLDFSLERLEKMKKLGPEDLRAVARKYLIPERAYSVVVTPREDAGK